MFYQIQNNTIYLTPNRRLATYIQKVYVKQEQRNNKQVFETCLVFPIKSWLINLWDFYLETNNLVLSLISDLQQQTIFEQIITKNFNNVLIKTSATAKSVADAYNLMQMYNISITDFALEEFNLDTKEFINWVNLYTDYCLQQGLIDFPKTIHHLSNNLTSVKSILTEQIYIIGFDEISPLIKNFLAKLTNSGFKLNYTDLTATICNKFSKKIACINEEQEIIMAAKWAKESIDDNPTETICVIVPNLESCRKAVERIFSYYFNDSAINISAPVPLTDYRVIQEAFLILDLTGYWIDVELISQFLRASFIHVAVEELTGRILFDVFIRELSETKFTLIQILDLLKQYQLKNQIALPKLELCLTQLYNLSKVLPKLESCCFWQQKFLEIFVILGWPNTNKFTKNEYQIIATWKNALIEYLSLQDILQQHSFSLAKAEIKKITSQIPFLPETVETKVNIYGILEAAGIPFDRIWLMGMHLQAWPPKPAPNPFIPHSIQKKFDLPRSSANRELEIAKRLLNTLNKCSNKEIVFSYASVIADNIMYPSRMIADILEINQTEKIELSSFKYQEDTLEIIEDTNGLSIEEQDIVGGTSVFAAQAECPFKAFTKFRLQAKALKTGSIGLLPEVRGEILHQVLAKFWRKFRNLSNLLVTPESKLDLDLAQIINSVILYWQKKLPNTLTTRFIGVEKKRIQEICKRWLEVEKTRANFVVSQIETSVVTHIGQAKIKIRLDRIDIDDQGHLIILDYKTGSVVASVLYGERLLAPQLPLYALAYKNSTRCVSFASLKANNLKFIGLAAEGGILANIKVSPNWDNQLAEWQTSLENIVREFMAGDARIMPINGSATCRSCDYAGVCRVNDSSHLCDYT